MEQNLFLKYGLRALNYTAKLPEVRETFTALNEKEMPNPTVDPALVTAYGCVDIIISSDEESD